MKSLLKPIFFSFLLFTTIVLQACKADKKAGVTPPADATPVTYSTWMADSEIKRNPEGWTLDFNQKPKWEYTHGLIMTSMEKLYEATGEEKYLNYIKNFAEFMIEEDGVIKTYKQSDYNIDRVQGGRFLIGLYEETGEERYKIALEELRQQMRDHPRTSEGGFWHKKIYPYQMWLDGLYMGSTFLARYADAYGEEKLFDDIANQFYLMDKYAYLIPGISFVNEDGYHAVVACDGTGDFRSVQEAINAVPDFRNVETRIFIKNGVYKEKLTLPASKNHVTLIGENKEKTILTYDDFAQKKNAFGEEIGTTGSSSFFIFGTDFTAKNLTFENSAGPVGQAVAVRVTGDRAFFENCRFLGFQDTVYAHGRNSRQYYKDCYIEGTTDFIFGWATAVFENCEIYSKKGGHYITAASTEKDTPYGFVFINSKLTGNAPAQDVYLGRPWRDYAQTVFINTEMGPHIKKEGWHNWSKPHAEKTAYYAEFGSTGPGASAKQRVKWAKNLSARDAQKYTVKEILKGNDNWDPTQKNSPGIK